jgi:crotonobetainyl-CoA:carnitine CoA-transferase CaiB-like acyl-CoA transferase
MTTPTKTDLPTGPCAGLKVLDFTTVISGPMCTQALGDYGADVIKIESPFGDPSRYSGAPFREPGFSGFLSQFNRNKRSVVVDLKSDAGRDLILDLVTKVDVVAENFRPDVMNRLGLGYEVLAARNPKLVYVAINGFGSDGPYADLPAYDQVMQGLVGLMPVQGGDGPPQLVQGAVADKSTALTALGGVLAALLARERDPERRGQRVEVAMIDAFSAFSLPEPMMERTYPPLTNEVSTGKDFFRCWETSDGYVVGLIIQDDQFAGLCRVIERADLATDDRFQSMVERFAHWLELVPLLAEEIAKIPSALFLERARSEGAPFAPVNSLDDFLVDPQAVHRQCVVAHEDPRFGTVQYVAPPVRFERSPASIDRHAPRLGEHTDEVLLELGVTQDALAKLKSEGAVR